MDAGDAVVFRVGSFRGEDTDAPRRSDPARADPFGNAAAEQAVVQLARFLYAFVMKQEARWSVRAARALRATGADVLGHGTAAGVYNRAVTDPTLSHLFMRAICGQFDDIEAREVLTPSEFASSGTSRQKAGIITPQAMVEMAFKLLEPNKGGGVQRDTFDMLWANGADSTAVVEYLAFASLSVAKNAKPAKFKAAVNTACEQEARAIDSRVSRDTVIAMYEDNINFANISAGLSRLEPTGKHYVFSSIFLPRLTRGDRDKLLKFSEVGKSLAEIKAGHTAHALGHVPEDQGVIDNLQLRRVHAYLSAAIEARQAAAAGGGPAAVAAVPPTGTTIPGRSPARDLEDTPFVRAYQPNTKEQTAATMYRICVRLQRLAHWVVFRFCFFSGPCPASTTTMELATLESELCRCRVWNGAAHDRGSRKPNDMKKRLGAGTRTCTPAPSGKRISTRTTRFFLRCIF